MNNPAVDRDVIRALTHRYFASHPDAAARRLETIDRAEATTVLADLPDAVMVRAWEGLDADTAADTLKLLTDDRRGALFASADTGKLAVRISRMEPDVREDILGHMDEKTAAEVRGLMGYPADTAGHLMDTRILAFQGDATAAEAVEALRRFRHGRRVVTLKIVDAENRLQSVVDIKDLALAQPDARLDSLAHGVPALAFPLDPREDIVDKLQSFKIEELPVIDPAGVLLGVIRHSELIDALQDTASVDIQTMVGVSKDERATSSSWFALRKRMPWLQVNLLTAFLAAAVVGVFEDTIAKFTALAVLLPVVAGQSGNAGAQALAVTMRGLALREIWVGEWLKVMLKEVNTGLWNGIAIAITCGIGVFVWSGQAALVFVIGSSMIIAMVMAGIAGALVPITLKKLGQDPAVASSIVLTTVTDIAGFFSFLGIATLMSSQLS
ncbi:MAG: magnesium transporter [Rhodospirillaceae bacterium]